MGGGPWSQMSSIHRYLYVYRLLVPWATAKVASKQLKKGLHSHSKMHLTFGSTVSSVVLELVSFNTTACATEAILFHLAIVITVPVVHRAVSGCASWRQNHKTAVKTFIHPHHCFSTQGRHSISKNTDKAVKRGWSNGKRKQEAHGGHSVSLQTQDCRCRSNPETGPHTFH